MPEPRDVRFFESSTQLHDWFVENHATASELWVGFHSRKSGRPTITWNELVDEELCFGWIDSVRHRLDEHRSAQRVTPRRRHSVWSAVNIRRFQELHAEGHVHPSGLVAFNAREDGRSAIYAYENPSVGLTAEMEKRFRGHGAAWKFFSAQAPWYRRTAAYWVASAKREETRERRLETLIEDSTAGRRLRHLSRP